jgi:hypothetical protein
MSKPASEWLNDIDHYRTMANRAHEDLAASEENLVKIHDIATDEAAGRIEAERELQGVRNRLAASRRRLEVSEARVKELEDFASIVRENVTLWNWHRADAESCMLLFHERLALLDRSGQ